MPPREEIRAKVCLVGEGAVGKTSLIRRFVHDEFSDRYIATLGAKVSKKIILVNDSNGRETKVTLAIWDIMGEERFRDIMKEAFFTGAHGILAVCDSTRKWTLHELDRWIAAVRSVAGDIPIHFLANKMDLSERRELEEEKLVEFAKKYHSPYCHTSAKTGENVSDAFKTLAQIIAG